MPVTSIVDFINCRLTADHNRAAVESSREAALAFTASTITNRFVHDLAKKHEIAEQYVRRAMRRACLMLWTIFCICTSQAVAACGLRSKRPAAADHSQRRRQDQR